MTNRLLLAVGALALAVPPAVAQDHLPPDVRKVLDGWREEHGRNWQLIQNELTGKARMLLGGGARAPAAPTTEDELFHLARAFVGAARGLFGLEGARLIDDRAIVLPLGMVGGRDKVAVRFEQSIDGVPVANASVQVLLDLSDGTLLAIDSTALTDAGDFDARATVDPGEAGALAGRSFELETGQRALEVGEPRLEIVKRVERGVETGVLTWAVGVHGVHADGTDADYLYRVAARSSAGVVERRNRVLDACPQQGAPVRGRVAAYATEAGDGSAPDCAGLGGYWPWDDGANRALVPLSGMFVTGDSGLATVTNSRGEFSLPRGSTSLALTFELRGPLVLVNSFVPPPPNGVRDNLILTTSLEAPSRTLVMNPAPTDREVAQVNAFHRFQEMREWVRSVNPLDLTMESASADTPGVPFRIRVNDQIIATGSNDYVPYCGASYSGSRMVVKFSVAGSGCPNAAFAPLIWHELGHWLNDLYHNGNDRRGFGEGIADTYAMYQMDYPELRYGSISRCGENTQPYCGDCLSRQGCYGEEHDDGLPMMGALWKVRRELKTRHGDVVGGAIADALFLGWLNAFDQDTIHGIILYQWLLLDDDDHDLTNGTPNLEPIERGFVAQSFPRFRIPITTVICP